MSASTTHVSLPQEDTQLQTTENKQQHKTAQQNGRFWKKAGEFGQGLAKIAYSVTFTALMALGTLLFAAIGVSSIVAGCSTGNLGFVGLGVGSVLFAGLCCGILFGTHKENYSYFREGIEHFKVAFENPQQDVARQIAKKQELQKLKTDLDARIETNDAERKPNLSGELLDVKAPTPFLKEIHQAGVTDSTEKQRETRIKLSKEVEALSRQWRNYYYRYNEAPYKQ